MPLPTIFDLCTPRDDVLHGSISESDFAADLAQVLRSEGSQEYCDPEKFFAFTYPTAGLKNLLTQVCYRLTGDLRQLSSIFRLHTSFGGGKTHSLIALVHAVASARSVPNIADFIDPAILPVTSVRIAGLEGENIDPINGHSYPEHCIKAFTPWGELALALAGKAGYERIRQSDELGIPPGADTLRELIGNEPCLILVDELAVYLRKARSKWPDMDERLASFLTTIFKAVESSPKAAIVFTLAVGKNNSSTDAHGKENEAIANMIANFFMEAESISARKAVLIDPTGDEETAKVLKRRLFAQVSEHDSGQLVDAYRLLWERHKSDLPQDKNHGDWEKQFMASYPLHPELMSVLTLKLSTLPTFQRVRGMLRLLAKTVRVLWQDRPANALSIHTWHINPGDESISNEILTRLNQSQLTPAVKSDVASQDRNTPSWAQVTDAREYAGMPPYASMVARTVLCHSLALNPDLQGCKKPELYYSVLAPGVDLGYLQDAERRFVENSAYRDDRPNAPLRFLQDANLTMLIRREERNVDSGDARAVLDDLIKMIFKGTTFEQVHFPSSPSDVPDDARPNRPVLSVVSYDACDLGGITQALPDLVKNIWQYKGANKDLRIGRNNVVFVVADHGRKDEMKQKSRRKLALDAMKAPDRIRSLPPHQQDKIRELAQTAISDLAVSVQQCYRHILYPKVEQFEPGISLKHAVLDIPNTSADPGSGQKQVERYLHDVKKLYDTADQPYSPVFIIDRTPLKRGVQTTLALRVEFYRDPALPMLAADGAFIKILQAGIDSDYFVYRRGDLVCGPKDPRAMIQIDEQSWIYTLVQAAAESIWPRTVVVPPPTPISEVREGTGGEGGGTDSTSGVAGPIFIDNKPLKECFAILWDETESKKIAALARIEISAYDIDAFSLMPQFAMLAGKKLLKIKASWKTASSGSCVVDFSGTLEEGAPFKDFLVTMLRPVRERTVQLEYRVLYESDGFSTTGEGPNRLQESLTRLGLSAMNASLRAFPKQ